jgi:hypothetical protein
MQVRVNLPAAAALFLTLLMAGCGYDRTMRFPSPSGQSEFEVWQRSIANEFGARFAVVTRGSRTFVGNESEGDNIIYFVHVYWTPDESKVGVFGAGAQRWNRAFEVQSGKEIPFDEIRQGMANSIRTEYLVPKDADPFGWAQAHPHEFLRHHKDVDLTYSPKASR